MRVGIIGFGKMGLLHASILNAFHDVKVIAVADKSEIMLGFLGKFKPEFKLYSEYKLMLDENNLDLAVISTPVSLHVPIALDCIAHKCNIFIEKPLALNVQDYQKLAMALQRHPQVRCVVGYCLRYRCTFRKFKEILERGILGPLISFQGTMYSSDVLKKQNGWRFTKEESGGGVVVDLGSHLLNLISWYFGLPQKLMATTERWFSDKVEDQVHTYMWFKDGIRGWIDACWSMPNYRLPYLKICLVGENGEVMVSNDELSIYLKKGRSGFQTGWTRQYAVDFKPEMEFEIAEEYYTLQLRDVINYINGTADHLNKVAFEDPTQVLIAAIYESARMDKPVYLDSLKNDDDTR